VILEPDEAVRHIALAPINDFVGVGVENLSDPGDRGAHGTLQNHSRSVNHLFWQGAAFDSVL
jgi:hypothetical protein